MPTWYNAAASAMRLLTVEAAQRRIVRLVNPVSTETVPVARGLGRVLAVEVKSIDLPPFTNSSVDGFAVRSADLRSASRLHPAELRVVGEILAGTAPTIRVLRGQAARIMTGAPMPRGADSVVMVEGTDHYPARNEALPPNFVRVFLSTQPGVNVRIRGSDARSGQVAMPAGTQLRPQELGLLSMLGSTRIRVHRRPVVAIMSGGNELLPAGRALRPGTIRDTNTATLAALAASAGCETLQLGIARDSRRAIEARLKPALKERVDLILTSAGVSVGALDLVRDVVRDHGQLIFWRVNVRPGKPLAVGVYHGIPFVGLPGNPVSAFVGFELFVRPAIDRLAGRRHPFRRKVRAKLTESISSDGRESYLRASLDERDGTYMICLTGHQGSGNLLSLVQANALLVVPAGVKSLAAGSQVEAWLL
jgi:molybdopterin molybdotransferase